MAIPFTENASKEPVNLTVAWYGHPICNITYNGGFHSEMIHNPYGKLFRGTEEGMPALIRNLSAEGWLRDTLRNPERVEYMRMGRRFLSNIIIYEDTDYLKQAPFDRIRGKLKDFTEGAHFVGQYEGPDLHLNNSSFKEYMEKEAFNATTPNFSGVQIKLAASLSEDGKLRASNKNFEWTGILKIGGENGKEALGVVEWLGLELAESAGLDVPSHALVNLGDDLPNALLVERFDIPQSDEDQNLYLIEDMCTASGVKTDPDGDVKYDSTMERVARIVKENSTDVEADMRALYRRTLVAWAIKDADMHMKNISFLKVADRDGDHFHSVRLSPVYDTLTTSIFVGPEEERQFALKIGGKYRNITTKTLLSFAQQNLGIPKSEAQEIMEEVFANIASRAVEIGESLPKLTSGCTKCETRLRCAITETLDQIESAGIDIPEWEKTYLDASEFSEKPTMREQRRSEGYSPF